MAGIKLPTVSYKAAEIENPRPAFNCIGGCWSTRNSDGLRANTLNGMVRTVAFNCLEDPSQLALYITKNSTVYASFAVTGTKLNLRAFSIDNSSKIKSVRIAGRGSNEISPAFTVT